MGRHKRLLQQLDRIEDVIDAIRFQLLEEHPHTHAQAYFDERRRDLDYDHAYRTAWRALQDPEDSPTPTPPAPHR